ncbi:putative RNA pseudouridine synthase [bioreactor metagenome]|uniref:Putative RNA pseudouridine synthase n=1 Tax=bioreactor metagenome TaxID=1076179 RepID=A0A644UA29_9ZZZZ|nr:RNA pseudouridine synthase [Candidatus Elulimicrobiales bacterium]
MALKKIKVLFENDNQIIIDKPAGIMSHPDGRKDEYTLADWLKDFAKKKFKKKSWQDILENIGDKEREGVVHRLDTGTTGVMVFALNKNSFIFLKKQFNSHTSKKTYRAIVVGHIKENTGIIDAAISRSKSDFRKKNTKDLFTNDGKGDVRGRERNAVTRYKVLARLRNEKGSPFTLVECYPETGRTHQIRVHLKSIRHPILGDDLYGVGEIERKKIQDEFKTKLGRPMLHAYSLKIKILDENNLPTEKTFIAEEHADMKQVLKELNYKA